MAGSVREPLVRDPRRLVPGSRPLVNLCTAALALGDNRPPMIARVLAVLISVAAVTVAPYAGAQETQGGQLSLDDCVHLALTRNERAKISDLQVVVADAAVEKARAGFLPIVTMTGNDLQHIQRTTPIATGATAPLNIGNSAFTVNQPIVNASAWPLYSQAKELADAQRAQNIDDKRLLAFTTAAAFFAVVNADDNLQAAQRQLKLAQDNLADTSARVKGGFNSTNDVTRAQVDMATSARQVEVNKGILDAAYVQLAFTIYAPVSGYVSPDPLLRAAQQPPGNMDTLVKFALDRRPDVIVAKRSADAAHDFASEPLLRLVPTLGVQGQATGTTNPPPRGNWNDETVSATLTWTIYDAGVRYADKHSRDAQASIADLTLQQLVRNVDAQVRGAVALLVSSQAALKVADDAVKSATQSYNETKILYGQGLAKAIELTDADDSIFAADSNYASAKYALATAYLSLRQALGLDALGTELK
jgi:outer membrane protein TolC